MSTPEKLSAKQRLYSGISFGEMPNNVEWKAAMHWAHQMKGSKGRQFKIDHKTTKLQHSFICQLDQDNNPVLLCIQRGEILGSGGFGKAKLAIGQDNKLYAIKIQAPNRAMLDNQSEVAIDRELGRDKGEFDRVREEGDTLNYQIKPYLGVSLADLLNEGELSLQEKIIIMHKVCQAVQSLHDLRVLHNDLNPGNILVQVNEKGQLEVSLIDFGLSSVLKPGEESIKRGEKGYPLMRHINYAPPEQLYPESQYEPQVSFATDAFQLGRLFEQDLGALIPGLLSYNPDARISIKEAQIKTMELFRNQLAIDYTQNPSQIAQYLKRADETLLASLSGIEWLQNILDGGPIPEERPIPGTFDLHSEDDDEPEVGRKQPTTPQPRGAYYGLYTNGPPTADKASTASKSGPKTKVSGSYVSYQADESNTMSQSSDQLPKKTTSGVYVTYKSDEESNPSPTRAKLSESLEPEKDKKPIRHKKN